MTEEVRSLGGAVERAAEALLKLGDTRPDLASQLAKLTTAVADEASRSSRFSNALIAALASGDAGASAVRRIGRRSPGVIDPFAVYGELGEDGLRSALGELDLEMLRDIIAEHGMDHDRLAMKWKSTPRVIARIVDKVSARTAKGSAFRAVTGDDH